MTETAQVVRRTITVDAPVATAFEVFTTRFGDFKPPEHSLLTVPTAETVIEPVPGGRVLDRGTDGSECVWGHVLAYEPPGLFRMSWDMGPTWQADQDPDQRSTVEVRFVEEAPGRTRVELEHRDLERHGPGWEHVRDGVADADGWPLYLDRYAALLAG